MEVEELRANRWKVGLLSIGLLIGAVITFLTVPERPGLTGALGRVGVLLGAFWLAVPQLLKSPRLLKYLHGIWCSERCWWWSSSATCWS